MKQFNMSTEEYISFFSKFNSNDMDLFYSLLESCKNDYKIDDAINIYSYILNYKINNLNIYFSNDNILNLSNLCFNLNKLSDNELIFLNELIICTYKNYDCKDQNYNSYIYLNFNDTINMINNEILIRKENNKNNNNLFNNDEIIELIHKFNCCELRCIKFIVHFVDVNKLNTYRFDKGIFLNIINNNLNETDDSHYLEDDIAIEGIINKINVLSEREIKFLLEIISYTRNKLDNNTDIYGPDYLDEVIGLVSLELQFEKALKNNKNRSL